jgi:RNA polymerase sigma-70 factor (ECF subfamily)
VAGDDAAAVTTDPDDSADADASMAGDGEAFARLVRRHQRRVASWLRRFTREEADLEDLIQETFVQAYLSLPGWRRQAPFGPWLRTIAVRAGYRYWRERRRPDRAHLPLGEDLAADGPKEQLTPAQAAELLERLLERLSPADRLVVTLLHLEECTVQETARLTGWPAAVVKVRAFRARRRLSRLLGEASPPAGGGP